MKKYLVILFTCLSIATTAPASITHSVTPKVTYVLICNSSRSYAYHSHVCRGLAHCRHGISKVTVAQAIKLGYKPCKICY